MTLRELIQCPKILAFPSAAATDEDDDHGENQQLLLDLSLRI